MMADGFGACVELANSRSSSKQKCKLVPLNPVTYSLLQRPALEFLNQVSSLSRICWHPQGILHTYLVAILTFSQVSTKPGSLRQQSFRKYFLSGRSSKIKFERLSNCLAVKIFAPAQNKTTKTTKMFILISTKQYLCWMINNEKTFNVRKILITLISSRWFLWRSKKHENTFWNLKFWHML